MKRFFASLAILFLIPTIIFAQSAAEVLRAQIEEQNKRLSEINAQIESNQRVLDQISNKGKTLERELTRIDQSIRQADLGIERSSLTISTLSLEIQALETEIDIKEKSIVNKREALIRLLQDFQKRDQEGLLLAVLNSKTISESVSEAQNIFDLNEGLLLEVNQIRNLKIELGDKLSNITGKKVSVEREKQTLEVRKDVAKDEKVNRAELLAETKNQEGVYKEVISTLEQKQQEISNQIAEIEEQLRVSVDPNTLPTARSGVLGWPVEDPFLTQEYGSTAFAQRAYKSKFHNGIDLRARPAGVPILAAEDGEVIAVGNNGNVQYGRYVLVKHENNLTTLYAHLSRQWVSKGDKVKRGDVIAASGNTGYSFAPHLHFVVYTSDSVLLKSFPGAGLVPVGSTLDPLKYLP